MTPSVRLTETAEHDIRVARYWYREYAPHVDGKFRRAVQEAFERIQAHPQQYQVVYRHVRKALVRKFPYGILYRVTDKKIEVIGVVHHSRDPRTWQRGEKM